MPDWTFCPKCATKLTPGAPACPGCGAALSDFTPTSDSTAPGEPADLGAAIEAELRDTLAPGLLLLKAIGHGGMGTVYLARDPALKRNVVVKVLAPWLAHDPTARARFEREAQSAAAVAHPNVVSVFQVGTLPQSGTSYFVMEYVEGQTLEQAFPAGTVVPEGRGKRIIGEIAAALAAAHKRGLVHRDIKPANVMLEAETDRVVVLDFGISAAASSAQTAVGTKLPLETKLTQEGTSLGTPAYMSPEQAAGEEVTEKSDVYSLGVVAFELLTGRPVFEETSPMAVIAAHINREAPNVRGLRPEVDSQLTELVDRCLRKGPDERPEAQQVALALGHLAGPVVEWPPPGLGPLPRAGAKFRTATLVAGALGLAFFAILAIQPSSTSPQWHRGEGSLIGQVLGTTFAEDPWPDSLAAAADSIRFGRRTLSDYEPSAFRAAVRSRRGQYDPDAGMLWSFVLALTTLGFLISILIVLRRTWVVVRLAGIARRAGYPRHVIVDVLCDQWPDTKDLLSGSGLYALADQQRRSWFLHLRRLRTLALLLTPLVGLLSTYLWIIGKVPGSTAVAGKLVPFRDFAAVLLPVALGLAVVIGLGVPEEAVRVSGRRRGLRRGGRGKALSVPADVAAAWARETPVLVKHKMLALPAALPVTVALFLFVAGVTLLGVAMVGDSIWVSRHVIAGGQERLPDWISRVGRGWNLDWRRTDSLFGQWEAEATDPEPSDSAVLVTIAYLMGLSGTGAPEGPGAEGGVEVSWQADSVLRRQLSQGYSEVREGLSDSLRMALVVATTSPVLTLLRRLAHMPALPPMWVLGGDYGERARAPNDLRPRRVFDLWEHVRLRQQAAMLLATDTAAALERVRELFSMRRQLLRNYAVVRRLRSVSLGGLWELRSHGSRRGSPVLQSQANVVWQEERRYQEEYLDEVSPTAFMSVMANPDDPLGLDLIADSLLPPFIRWELIAAIADGYCANAREVLFGVSLKRLDALATARTYAKDLEGADAWTAFVERWLRILIQQPDSVRALRGLGPMTTRGPKAGSIILPSVQQRIHYCQSLQESSDWAAGNVIMFILVAGAILGSMSAGLYGLGFTSGRTAGTLARRLWRRAR